VEAVSAPLRGTDDIYHGISVHNIGLPILPAEVKYLSDRGFRGNAAKQKIPAGTGIGLYIAHRIMDLHQGLIQVKPSGNETRMTLFFPMSRVVDPAPIRVNEE